MLTVRGCIPSPHIPRAMSPLCPDILSVLSRIDSALDLLLPAVGALCSTLRFRLHMLRESAKK